MRLPDEGGPVINKMDTIQSTRGLLPVKVLRILDEAAGIRTFELVSNTGDPLPPFEAGAHIDVHIDDRLCRQYSLCNHPDERHRYVIGVLREPESRGGSRGMHDAVSEGDVLMISAPRNLFPLQSQGNPTLLFAGGIGITPIVCMAEQLHAERADFRLYYCGRSLSRMAFAERIRASAWAASASIHADDGAATQKLELVATLAKADKASHIYVCGPGGFIEAVLAAAEAAGFPPSQVHREYFTAEIHAQDGDMGFDVRLARTGDIDHVERDETVVQALGRHGIVIETSCEQGICGTCLTDVLEGRVDHRDMYLSEQEKEEGKVFLPCCSRSCGGTLVLDL
jgi:vanillate O-demethylase ferredoxin subunit